MKNYLSIKIVSISLFISMILLQGCNKQEVIDVRQTEVTQGLLYKLYENEPFTGKVYNMSFDYFLSIARISLPLPPVFQSQIIFLGHPSCEVNFQQGKVNGDVYCSVNNEMAYQAHFSESIKNGEEQFFVEIKGMHYLEYLDYSGLSPNFKKLEEPVLALYKNHWKLGVRDGKEELYLYPSQQLIVSFIWKGGKKNGHSQVNFNSDNISLASNLYWHEGKPMEGIAKFSMSNLESKTTVQNEKVINLLKKYTSDSKQYLHRAISQDFSNNKFTIEEFGENNQLIKRKNYENGIPNAQIKKAILLFDGNI